MYDIDAWNLSDSVPSHKHVGTWPIETPKVWHQHLRVFEISTKRFLEKYCFRQDFIVAMDDSLGTQPATYAIINSRSLAKTELSTTSTSNEIII